MFNPEVSKVGLGWAPVLSNPAGNCLTTENWCEVGVQVASYDLVSLLLTPGLDNLRNMGSLAKYVYWPRKLVLNAASLRLGKNDSYELRSAEDGRRVQVDDAQISTLLATLEPDFMLLPKHRWSHYLHGAASFPAAVFPFIHASDLSESSSIQRPFGVYFLYHEETCPVSTILSALAQLKHLPCYVAGALGVDAILELIKNGVQIVESIQPVSDACLGYAYSSDRALDLNDPGFAWQSVLIDAKCQCPTCQTDLTRAYLYHLLRQTPNLAQRFIAQHNAYYCQVILSAGA